MAFVVVVAACSDDDGAEPKGSIVTDGSSETAFIGGDTSVPSPDAEPPPGDVCGIKSGLQGGASWPLRGGCTTRAGWSATAGPTSGQVYFSIPALTGESSPAIGMGEIVWVGTTDGNVIGVTNQQIRWVFHTGGAVKSSPAIGADGGVAIVGSMDGFLYSLRPEDAPPEQDAGVIIPDGGFYRPPPRLDFLISLGPIASSPVIGGDGTIYVGTTSGKLISVKPDGSGTNWTATTNDTLGSSPALGQDGTIYVGSSDQKLYALGAGGERKWALDLGSPVSGSPAVGGDGSIYVGTSDGKLHAVSSGGAEKWSYTTEGSIKGTPAVYAGSVYVGSTDKQLHAVSTVDGKSRWKYATLGEVSTPLIASDGTIFVGSTDLRVYAITSKGSLFYAVNAKGPIHTAPALGSGPLLYIAADNALVAVSN